MAKKMSPLLPLLGLGGLAALLFSQKAKAASAPGTPSTPHTIATTPTLPATPPAPSAARQSVAVNGHSWTLVTVTNAPPLKTVDVYAPAGSWGPHGELRVLRFTQVGTAARVLTGAAEGVPKPVLDAAIKDLSITIPGAAAAAATAPSGPVSTSPSAPVMPSSLQQEMLATMTALGVDAGGVVRGPVTAAAIQHATELSSRLEQAGFPQAAAALRSYAQAAGKLLPPPATPPAPIPGVPPETAAAIARALQLERDPQKLEALKASLRTLPPSAQRDQLIGALDALILQIRTQQALSQAATDIDEMTRAAQATASLPPGQPVPGTDLLTPYVTTRVLKLTKPNMSGPDVTAWQLVLQSAGYDLGKSGADGFFGPTTEALTKKWQAAHGLTPDGQVGPQTRAKIGLPPTTPASVPATASPRPDPAPKTALEVTAEAVATHLRNLQSKWGVAGSKGKQDMTLVKRFQSAAGGTADGLPGPGTIVALARAGQGQLPAVMYWGRTQTRAKDLPAFRKQLTDLAAAARSRGNPTLASQLEASAARETGAGGLP